MNMENFMITSMEKIKMNQKNRKLPDDLKRIFNEIDSMSDYFKELELMKEKNNDKRTNKRNI